ncbi:biotin F [Wolffia australiana]
MWDEWVEAVLARLESRRVIRVAQPISLPGHVSDYDENLADGPRPDDRAAVEVEMDEPTFKNLIFDDNSPGVKVGNSEKSCPVRKLILFSGNDYLGLSTHPAVRMASMKASMELGMGPRGSALICGHTNYHKLLEDSLANLKKKESCILCPTGFAANMAFISALGSMSSILASDRKSSKNERIAIFSDALNHASIIDGIHLAERRHEVEVFVYKHCNMTHLDVLLSSCTAEKKVVITDSLFSMDGDFAPMNQLVRLRKKHNFLLAIDDAHGTLVCGNNGGGVAELYDCEDDVDICIGTLSKAAGCQGGFIACSAKWKLLIMSRGRSFIFSTALPVPVVAAAHAAVMVSRKEKWRRKELWRRVTEFSTLTKHQASSPIVSLVVGSEEAALSASRYMIKHGFHVIAIRPPTVPANSCRLRLTLCAAHTSDDIKQLADALSLCVSLQGGSRL